MGGYMTGIALSIALIVINLPFSIEEMKLVLSVTSYIKK